MYVWRLEVVWITLSSLTLSTSPHQPYSEELEAATSIQAAGRRRIAGQAVDAEFNWRMYNVLDEDDEHVHNNTSSSSKRGGCVTLTRLRLQQGHLERRAHLMASGLKLPTIDASKECEF